MTHTTTMIRGLLHVARLPGDGGLSMYERAHRMGSTARILEQAGMPRVALADAFREDGDLSETTALAAARRWAASPVPADEWETVQRVEPRRTGLLVFAGPMGTGKTQAAATLMRLRVEAGRRAGRWFGCRGLALRDLDELDRLAATLLAEPFLVLDDVGGEGSRGKKADELLASLVSRRADQEPGPRGEQPADRVTVITSNLYPPGYDVPDDEVPKGVDPVSLTLTAVFGPRAADRFALWGEVVECVSASMRSAAKPLDVLPVPLRRAARLCSLVRRLDRLEGYVEPEAAALPLEQAAMQLGRIVSHYLGHTVTRGEARKLAEESDRIQAEGHAAFVESLRVALLRFNAPPVDLARCAGVEALLERDRVERQGAPARERRNS
jgi:hypothetical protein